MSLHGLLWTIVSVLVILWLIGFAGHVAGDLIHLLLMIALLIAVSNAVANRRAASAAPAAARRCPPTGAGRRSPSRA